MKTLMTFVALAALAVAAPGPASPQKSKAKPQATKAAVPTAPAIPTIQPLTIPKDAVAGPNGVYNYTDKDGKKWVYSQGPFGLSRTVDMGPMPPAAPVPVNVIDLGETVRFERPGGPFGTMRWERKKTELTQEERQILETQAQKSGQN